MKLNHKINKIYFIRVLLCSFLMSCFFNTNGFEVQSKELSAQEATTATELASVVVTGEKLQDFIRQNPSQVVSMGIDEIRERNFLAVGDALGSMPGVDISQSSSSMGTRISIRGGGGSGSVLVLIDGRPAATSQYGSVDLSSIPIDVVKRILVFKPPVPVWLGPGSSAGAIYIETRSGKAKKEGTRFVKTGGRVRVLGGSFGEAALNGTGRVEGDDYDLMIAGGAAHRDGKRDNSQKDQGHFNLHYGKKEQAIDYEINTRVYISDHGISGPTYNPTPNASQRYEKASMDLKLSGLATDFMDYEIKTFLDIEDLSDQSNTGSISELDALTAGAGTDLFVTGEDDNNEFRLGGLCTFSKVDHTLSGKHDRTAFSFNGVHNFKLLPFRFTTGLRADYTSDFHFSPGGHIGVSFETAPKTIIKANVGYSENVPSFGQLYQPSHGSVDQVRGNSDLEKEEIVSVNIGLYRLFAGSHQLEISLFRTDTKNLIKYQRGADLINRPENISDAYKQGVEASIKLHLADKTDLDISYIWQETKNKQNNAQLSYAPRHTAKLVFKKTFGPGTRLNLTGKGVSEQFTDLENTTSEKLEHYFTVQADIIQPIRLFEHKAEVFVQVQNLLDEDYSAHFGYPDDGVRFQCGMNFNF